jgi:hypothetical protein
MGRARVAGSVGALTAGGLVARRVALLLVLGATATAHADDAVPPPARAPRLDEIVLKNGRVFEGRIQSEDERRVVLGLESDMGCGTVTIERSMIREVRRGADRAPLRSPQEAVTDQWYLLRSGGRTLGTRRLLLRRTKPGTDVAWRLEEHVVHFAHGRFVPATTIARTEETDLALRPVALDYHEVGDASGEPGGMGRYQRLVVGKVRQGVLEAKVHAGGQDTVERVELPPDTRGRLGTREDLLRRRQPGVEAVAFVDVAERRIVTVRAGYTAIDQPDGQGGRYDEFTWEEDGRRLVWRFDGERRPVYEEVAEGVVAQPVTEAQAAAAAKEGIPSDVVEVPAQPGPLTAPAPVPRELEEVVLPEVGVAFRVPGPAWKTERPVSSPTDEGPRVVAKLSTAASVADVRVEWHPDGFLAAPGLPEAKARLLERLRSVCPDLQVTEPEVAVPSVPRAWRLGLRGTLRGEVVRTIAVVVDRGPARVLFLCACPEVAWVGERATLEAFVASIRVL